MFKVKAEGLGTVGTTKKGNGIRKFLVALPNGQKDVFSIWAKSPSDLSADGVQELSVRPGDMLFLQDA
jgi:hypothetical protein